MKIKETSVNSELELEDLLSHEPETIEEGFRILTRQPRTSPKSNRLDLLGVDSEGTLTVIELKVREDDEQIIQALEYFDWLMERGIHFFRDHFSFKDIELTTPRIILIAPHFSERAKVTCKYLSDDIDISLRRYVCYQIESHKEVKLIEEIVPEPGEIEQPPPDFPKLASYIRVDKVRDAFSKTHELIQAMDTNVTDSLLPYRANYWYRSLKFAQMSPTRDSFWLEWKQEKGGKWGYKKVKSLKEARRVLDSDIRKALEVVKGT
jgi:hypothetical protein